MRRMASLAAVAVLVLAACGPDKAVHYTSCAAARAADDAPLKRGDAGYSADLDRDGDGVACEVTS